ncbi:redoxin family protein [Thiolapillus sp.]
MNTSRILIFAVLLAAGWNAQALEPLKDKEATRWLGVEVVKPEDGLIGKQLGDMPFHDLQGRPFSLHKVAGKKGTVVVVRDPQCPVSRRYGPRIASMGREFSRKGFSFVFIYLNESLDQEALLQDAARLNLPNGVMVGKGSFFIAHALGVKSTGDVFVLDDEHRLIYRGAIDDQYGFGYTQEAPTHNYLRNALDAELKGWPVEPAATHAPGCYIDADPEKDDMLPEPGDGALS